MAKRNTGVGSKKISHPQKTKKRLAIKRATLTELASKKRRHNRPVRSLKS